jgi:hypothetical protein
VGCMERAELCVPVTIRMHPLEGYLLALTVNVWSEHPFGILLLLLLSFFLSLLLFFFLFTGCC